MDNIETITVQTDVVIKLTQPITGAEILGCIDIYQVCQLSDDETWCWKADRGLWEQKQFHGGLFATGQWLAAKVSTNLTDGQTVHFTSPDPALTDE